MNDTKPGVKTTESWAAGAVVAAGSAIATGQIAASWEGIAALGVAGATAIGYALARSMVKRGRPQV